MTCIYGLFDLLVVNVILGSFGAVVSKMAGLRAKYSEMWDSVTAVICIGVAFNLLVFNVI